jgi:3',5'-cyclic AMP phosphodiesterase CpdA
MRPRARPVYRWAALLLAGTGCLHDTYREAPLGPPPAQRTDTVRILVFGDFGYRTLLQSLASSGMRRAHAERPFDLAVQLGDNLYMCGPDPLRPGAERCRFAEDGATVAAGTPSPDDPIFRVNEAPLEGLRDREGGPLPIYLALGNHDIGWGGERCAVPGLPPEEATRRRACLSVARRSPEWRMPGRHYVVDRGPVRLIVIDTNLAVADYGGFTLEQELAFLREATAPCGPDRPCFVAGHHPPAALVGWRVRPSAYRARMDRLVAATGGRVRAFLAGHVHTLEHLALGELDVFVSGSTAMGGYMRLRNVTPPRARVRFASNAWGWAELEADARGYAVRFFDVQGEPLHCCEASQAGPCRPVECA